MFTHRDWEFIHDNKKAEKEIHHIEIIVFLRSDSEEFNFIGLNDGGIILMIR